MLGEYKLAPAKVSRTAVAASVILHVLVLAFLLYRPEPPLLQPESSLRGEGGGGHNSVKLIAPGTSEKQTTKQAELQKDRNLLPKRPKSHPTPQPQTAKTDTPPRPGMPGFILGSLASGVPSDHDVRVALPLVAPDPPIMRNRLPDWLRGDVIVEVTIDEQGNVVKTVVLQTVGYGLENMIVDTLRQWRFSPATIDGVKVASRQDVHFHFPS
jgi:TonB family protein